MADGSINLGDLVVSIGADMSGLRDGVTQTSGMLNKLSTLGKGIVFGAAVTGIMALVKSSQAAVAEQVKLATQLQQSVEAVQTLSYMSDLTGISLSELTQMSKTLNDALMDAADSGTGDFTEALAELGLEADSLLALDMDQRIATIGKAMQELGLTTSEQIEKLKGLGIGREYLEAFSEKAIQARQDLRDFNVSLNDIDAQNIADANEAWKTSELLLKGIGNNINAVLAPVISEIANKFTDAGRQSQGFSDTVRGITRDVLAGLGVIPASIQNIRIAWDDAMYYVVKGANGFIFAVNKIGDALDWLSGNTSKKLPEIDNQFGKIRDTIGDMWDMNKVQQWIDGVLSGANQVKLSLKSIQQAIYGNEPTKFGDDKKMTDEQRKSLENRFEMIRQSVANEDALLQLQRDKRLKDLAELGQKEIGTAEQREQAKLEILANYEKKKRELIQSMFEESYMREDELLQRQYDRRLEQLDHFENSRTLTTEQAIEVRRRMEEKFAQDMALIEARKWGAAADVVGSALSQMQTLVGDKGGAAFEILKALSMATAVVKGYEAVVSAWATGNATGIPGMGAILAGVTAAGVAAQIASLAATKPGTGASKAMAPVSSAGAAEQAAVSSAQAGVSRSLLVQGINPGQMFSGQVMRDFAQQMIQFQADGGQVVLI